MADMLDYLRWRQDVPLAVSPFNPVDGLILSQLAYMPFDRVMKGNDNLPLSEVATRLMALDPPCYNSAHKHQDAALLWLVKKSLRFGNALVTDPVSEFDPEREKQFAAVTFLLDDCSQFVSFRGTDGTLVGWKEDFNMVFSTAVPAQLRATEYLELAAAKTVLPLRVGGHSKGGNLAIYSSSHCCVETSERIISVYNNDGPGLNDSDLLSEGYRRMEDRIHCYLPQTSIIGMLMCHCGSINVVHSVNSGPRQHAPYSWATTATGFVGEKGLDKRSITTDKVLKNWAACFTPQERQVFFDTMYGVFSATDATTVAALKENKLKSLAAMLAAAKDIDPQSRKTVLRVIGALLSTSAQSIRGERKPRRKPLGSYNIKMRLPMRKKSKTKPPAITDGP